MNWLNGLRKVLDATPSATPFFLRDDDGGWEDERLFELLDVFRNYNVPIDLVVIPKVVSRDTANRLRKIVETDVDQVAIHQHGYAHINHEQNGRKCEFGESRSRDQQLTDICAGRDLLRDLFGPHTDPIFTPPWNRCTATTIECLRDAGVTVLSRDVTAAPLPPHGLVELPVSIDWFARRKGVRLTRDELGDALAEAAALQGPVGVMLHHAIMDKDERDRLGELLALLTSHSQVQCALMRNLVRPAMRGATS
jgi:peptidoglycan/xylan/chitin deacetylase (PgdA/CDA1 family)